MNYILRDIKSPPLLETFVSAQIETFDLYWIVHPLKKLNKEERKTLKEAGWALQRHSRSNEEMWVFDKVDWEKTNAAKGAK